MLKVPPLPPCLLPHHPLLSLGRRSSPMGGAEPARSPGTQLHRPQQKGSSVPAALVLPHISTPPRALPEGPAPPQPPGPSTGKGKAVVLRWFRAGQSSVGKLGWQLASPTGSPHSKGDGIHSHTSASPH